MKIGKTLKNLSFIKSVEPIETNIVIFNLKETFNETDFIKHLENYNILIASMGQGKLRMVTHLDVSDDMIKSVIDTLQMLKF
jgi:threonine aldolase